MRFFKSLLLVVLWVVAATGFAGAAGPQDAWQAVISGQIEAFRTGDETAALGFAGAGFHRQFRDAQAFVAAVEASGYAPLVHSRSHSFGAFTQVDETHVVQEVKIVGPDQLLYQALYQLEQEPEGWRVAGVALKRGDGVAI